MHLQEWLGDGAGRAPLSQLAGAAAAARRHRGSGCVWVSEAGSGSGRAAAGGRTLATIKPSVKSSVGLRTQ